MNVSTVRKTMASGHSPFNTRPSLIIKIKDSYNDKAWEEFVHFYQPFIYGVSRKLGVSEADLDDIVQKVILKSWEALPGFEYDSQKGRFKNWLAQITRNIVLTHFRSRQREKKRYESYQKEVDEIDSGFETMIESQWKISIGEIAWNNIKDRFSDSAIQSFDHIKQGHKNKDIAKTLGIDANSVAVYKKRIVSSLQKEVQKLNSHLS